MQPWLGYALGSAAFAGLTAIFGKLGVGDMPSNLATFIRTLVIVPLLAVMVSASGQWQMPQDISGRAVAMLVLSGVATGFSWLCYYRALQLAPASQVAPVDKLSVVFVVVLSALFLGEAISAKVALGCALVTAGAMVLAL